MSCYRIVGNVGYKKTGNNYFFLPNFGILGHHDTQRFMLKNSTFNASHNFFIFIALPPVAAIMLYFCEKVHTDKQKNYIALGLKDIFLA